MLHRTILVATGSLAALVLATPALAACEDLAGMQIAGGQVDSAQVVAQGEFTPPAGGMGPPMERPLCAWPMEAVHDGVGDPAVASSFQCRAS